MKKLELQNRKGQRIVGVLEIPEGTTRGTCIVQHGWGGHRNKPTVVAIKNAFLESGFQTFNFDTTNSFGESDGDYEKSTLGLHWEDFEDVTLWAQQQSWFKGPLALTGHSKGGYASLRYAQEHPEQVSYVVAVAPVVSGELSFQAAEKDDKEGLLRWKETGVKERVGKEGNLRREHWFQMEERLQHSLLPLAEKLTMPVLFIVGSEDVSCPPEHIRILFEAMPENSKEIKILPGAPHSFYKEEEQEMCKSCIKAWLR